MPNKTIYIADRDLKLVERAQELAGGNLSAAIATALRRFVEMEEARDEGFKEIVVRVGPGQGQPQRFMGVQLGEWGEGDANQVTTYRVYRSRKGKFVLHVEKSPEVSSSGGIRGALGLGQYSWGVGATQSTLTIVDTLDELQPLIPASLFAMVSEYGQQTTITDLDI